jgi:hypothetical protein
MSPLLLVSFALAAPVPKDASAELKWKFIKGDVFYIKCLEESSATAGVPGEAPRQKASSITEYHFKIAVVSTGEQGTMILVTFESIRNGADENGGRVVLQEDKSVSGQSVILDLNAKQQITKVYVEVEKTVPTRIPTIAEIVRYRIGAVIQAVPGKQLGKGEKWTNEWETPQNYGTVKLKTRGVVDGITDGIAKLAVEVDREWTKNAAEKAKADAQFAYDSVKGENGQRTIWFDTKAGRVQKLEESYTLTGEFQRGGAELQLTQQIKVTTTVSGTPPKDK